MFLITGCNGNGKEREAGIMLEKAQKLFESDKHAEVRATIDSLRHRYPQAVETRKKALKLYQDNELKIAQLHIACLDKALSKAQKEVGLMEKEVEQLKSDGKITAGKLSALTRKKIEADSLKALFDMECSKIKYINRKKQVTPDL